MAHDDKIAGQHPAAASRFSRKRLENVHGPGPGRRMLSQPPPSAGLGHPRWSLAPRGLPDYSPITNPISVVVDPNAVAAPVSFPWGITGGARRGSSSVVFLTHQQKGRSLSTPAMPCDYADTGSLLGCFATHSRACVSTSSMSAVSPIPKLWLDFHTSPSL